MEETFYGCFSILIIIHKNTELKRGIFCVWGLGHEFCVVTDYQVFSLALQFAMTNHGPHGTSNF
ncbi:hypothetical protein A2W12_02790 [Candidatus Nomurabacteria bacterium RBG_16_40_11]|nr:MAG: hypothetical protein A2W12_02790 [Candidatus Nomurabacteria bacterium RBG_16_40_11]